jgi:hypothetical protein
MQVYSYGGDVMRFAGDSVICAFLPTPEEAKRGDKGLAATTLRSVRCAAVLADDLGAFAYLAFKSCLTLLQYMHLRKMLPRNTSALTYSPCDLLVEHLQRSARVLHDWWL